MTMRRDETNSTDALYEVARSYPGGVEAVAGRLGISPSVLYKKLEHVDGIHHLRHDEFDRIMAICAAARVPDAYRPLRAQAWRHGHVAVKLPDVDDRSSSELAAMVVAVFKEGGDVARAVEEALASDAQIDAAEAKRIEMEISQAIEALVVLQNRVRRAVPPPVVPIKAAR